MKSILFACLLGFVQIDAPEVAPGQVKVAEQKVKVTVGKLRLHGYGWIEQSAVVIDEEGYCWIRKAAEVYAGEKATPTGIQIVRTDKGYGLIVSGRPKWEMTNRASLVDVVPCMTWEDLPLSLRRLEEDAEPPIEKFKTVPKNKKGLE